MSSSVGMIIPNIWKNKECSKPPNIAIENGPVEIVELPSKNGDFPVRKLLVYQRVTNQIASVPQNHHQVGPHLASPSQDTAPRVGTGGTNAPGDEEGNGVSQGLWINT